MTNGLLNTSDLVMRRLQSLVQESPDLKNAAQFYEAILSVLCHADSGSEAVSLTPEQVRTKMEKGLPLLRDLKIALDIQSVSELMVRLARAVETASEDNSPLSSAADARLVRFALEERRLDVAEFLRLVAAGEKKLATSLTESLRLNADLLWMLAQNALKPALLEWSRQLAPLAKGIRWDRGYCFICGASPTFGELRGNAQAKHLRCGQCGADWPFSRLQCTYCGNEDHAALGLLYVESEREKRRLEVCNKCSGYLKVIASFSATRPEMLVIEDLATLDLDYVAQEKGYSRPTIRRVFPDHN